MKPNLRNPVTVLLLVAALSASAYLLVRALALVAGTAADGDVCSALFASGCDEILRDSRSMIGGIPLAGWGVIHFASLLGLLVLGRLLGDSVRNAMASAAALLAVLGGVGSIALLVVIAMEEVPLCPLCLAANGLNLMAIVPILKWTGRPLREVAGDGKRAVKFILGGRAESPEAVPLRSLALLCSTLFAVVLFQWVLIEWDRAFIYGMDVHPEQVLAAYAEEPEVEIPIVGDEASAGPKTARATLVVFSDAFCSACRGFWTNLPKLMGPYGEDLRVVFKHFPLDPPCNAAAKKGLHPFACQAGIALEGALRQGKFWQYQSMVQAPDPLRKKGVDVFLEAAKAVNLDVDQFQADMKDASLKEKLERDVTLGVRLGVDATPTMFLNGRRIRMSSPKALKILLEEILGERIVR